MCYVFFNVHYMFIICYSVIVLSVLCSLISSQGCERVDACLDEPECGFGGRKGAERQVHGLLALAALHRPCHRQLRQPKRSSKQVLNKSFKSLKHDLFLYISLYFTLFHVISLSFMLFFYVSFIFSLCFASFFTCLKACLTSRTASMRLGRALRAVC